VNTKGRRFQKGKKGDRVNRNWRYYIRSEIGRVRKNMARETNGPTRRGYIRGPKKGLNEQKESGQ